MNEPLVLTQSTIKDFTRCPRKWWLGHYRKLRKRHEYRSPSTVGNFVHDALAAYYDGESPDPVDHVRQRAEELTAELPEWEEEIRKDAELAELMVEGYIEWLQETGEDFELETVEPERTVRATLKPGVVLQGKLDGKVKRRDGWTAFLEHKTVGNFVDLPATAQINRQYLTYHLLEYLELLEEQPDAAHPTQPLTGGAILNMLRKVKRTARAKPPFYLRHPVQHNIHELRSHWKHTVAVAERIAEATDALDAGEDHHRVVPPVDQTSCRWECPFFQICPQFDDGSDVQSVIELEYEEHDPLARYQ